MKKKWIVGIMMALCLGACSACSLPFDLPFGDTSEESSVSSQVETSSSQENSTLDSSIGDEETSQAVATIEGAGREMLAIRVIGAEEDAKLMDIMRDLQMEGRISLQQDEQGMVTAINGKANAADWSACWMLYTSDAELSNTAWGTYDYNGETLGSAALGADSLPVVNGEIYVWVYTSF